MIIYFRNIYRILVTYFLLNVRLLNSFLHFRIRIPNNRNKPSDDNITSRNKIAIKADCPELNANKLEISIAKTLSRIPNPEGTNKTINPINHAIQNENVEAASSLNKLV